MTEPNQPRPGSGTTVTARNLFYNLPVRKKSLNEGLELEKIRFRVAGLALMWPLISFSLRDDVTGNVVLQTHKCSGILATFSSLFGGARAKHMREVKTQNDIFQVSGYVSRENYSRKDLQFVFVNRRLVLKSKVHKMLNSVLSKSVLVRRRGNLGDKSTKQAGQDRSPFAEGGSPTKLFERYAVYVINIDCPLTAYDITFDPAKTLVEFHDWPELTRLIEAMLLKFLQDENLLLPSEEGPGAEEPGLGSAATVLDKESTSFAPDLMRETDDPFNGADDGFDVEFHADLQRKQYTRGISTHNNLNSLFSRTVRRPIQPHEEEGFGDFKPSSPKKIRPDSSTSGTADESQQVPPGDSKFGTTDDKVGSFVTPAGTHLVKGSATGTSQRVGQLAEKQVLPTRRESLRPGNGQRFKENSPTHNAEGAAESMDNEDAEITLPQAVRPLKRVIHPTSHKQMLSERHSDQALASGSASNAKQICLPHHFAHSSSLSRLRARLARELTPSLSPSSNRQETHGSASATTSSPHVIERSRDQSNSRPAACKEMLHLGMELDGKPTEIVLPPMKRPPLFRSRSLDAECSLCCRNTCCCKHKISDSSRASHKAITRMSDDTNINYSSNQMADFEHRKHGFERSSLITINPHHLTARTGMRVGGSAIQNVLGGSMPSHHCSGIPHETCTTHNDASVPGGVNTGTFHRHPVPANRKEEDIPLPPTRQVVHTKDFSKVTSSEIERSGSSASRPVDHRQSTAKLAHTDESTAPRPVDYSSSAGPCSFCPSSSKRSGHSTSGPSGPIVSASRSGTVSQASKLAQLMRKKDVPNSCDDVAGSGGAGVSKNPSFHHARCSRSEKNETALLQRQHLASHSMRTVTQLPQAFYMQREMHGRDQSVHNWHDATALQKLTTAQSIQSSLNQKCSKSTETQEPREKRFDRLSHLEKPHAALKMYSKGEHGKDVHEPGESDAQHHTEQRVYHQNTAACNLPPTSHVELPTSNASTSNKNVTASKMPGDGRNQQESLQSGRTAGSFPVAQRHVPFSVHKLTAWHDSQQHLSKVPVQSWRGDEVSSSGDRPVPQCPRGHAVSSQELPAVCALSGRPVSPAQSSSGSHQRVELAQSNTQEFAAVCASSGRPVSLAKSSRGSHQREELAQSNTQGFAAVSSQGFVPQLAEDGSGTMPFEVQTGVLSQTPSQTHTDSPMSTQSMGFSPTVADPLLADPDARNTTSPVLADLHVKETPNPVMADQDAKNTTSPIRAHPDAENTTNPVSVDPDAKNTTGPPMADPDAKNTTNPVSVDPGANTTNPVSVDPDDKNTTNPASVDPDAKNTTNPVSVDPDAKNTTNPVSVDPNAKNTTNPVSAEPDAKNTTNPVSVDPDAKNTTNPASVDPDPKNTTNPASVDPDAKNTTNPASVDPDAKNTANPVSVDPDVKNTTNPVSVDPDAKNTANPVSVDPDAKNTANPVSVDPDAKNTANPVSVDPDAVISTKCTTGNSDIKNAVSPVTVQEKTTHSQSSMLCPVSSNELTSQKVLALAGSDMTEDFRKMTNETGSSVCVCEHNSCQLPDHPDAGSDDNMFSQRLRTCLCGNQNVPVSQTSPAGGQPHVPESGCVISTREADNLEEENTLTDSSEIPCGQGRIYPLVVSSIASGSSVASSCGSDSQFLETALGTWPAVVNRPAAKNVHDAENKGSGHNGDHLYTRQRSEHGDVKNQKCRLRLEDGQENDCHKERTFATALSEVVASGTEPVFVHNNQSPPVSDRTVHQTKRKLAVERTYNLSFLSGKKPRSVITSGSSCAAANKGEPPASLSFSSRVCDERTLVENQVGKTPLPSKDFGEAKRDVCLAQESDSFGDSVPDSALACVAMPDNTPASAADSEIKIPIPLPDSALAGIAMSGNVPTAATRDIGTQNVMPDSTEKYVSTASRNAQIASNTANSVSNSLADVEMPVNPAVSQTTPTDAVQSASNTPSSVPDSVIIMAVVSESESAASPRPYSQVTGTAGRALSDYFTQVTPAATVQTGASDTFTQNAYRLGSAPPTAASDGVAGEGPGLSSSQPVFPGTAPSPSKGCTGEEELVSEQPHSSHETPVVGGGGSTRQDGEGVGEEGEWGKEAGAEAPSKEAVWIPVTDPSTGMCAVSDRCLYVVVHEKLV